MEFPNRRMVDGFHREQQSVKSFVNADLMLWWRWFANRSEGDGLNER